MMVTPDYHPCSVGIKSRIYKVKLRTARRFADLAQREWRILGVMLSREPNLVRSIPYLVNAPVPDLGQLIMEHTPVHASRWSGV